MQLRDEGGSSLKVRVCIDAMPIFLSLLVERVEPPSKKSLFCHLLWLKELIQSGAVASSCWIETRDMTADGHTEGSIDRVAITQVSAGQLVRSHAPKVLSRKTSPASEQSSCVFVFLCAMYSCEHRQQAFAMAGFGSGGQGSASGLGSAGSAPRRPPPSADAPFAD